VLYEPTWDALERRRKEFAPWADDRLMLDSVVDLSRNIATALVQLRQRA
jgi:hypothetical protein